MKLDVFRLSYKSPRSTPGRLSINGIAECCTLELPWNGGQNRHDIDCFPAGVYPVVINFSPAHQKMCMQIMNVPNRDGIRIDQANFPSELLGCIAVGETAGEDCVNSSAPAYLDLYEKVDNALKSGDTVTIEIHDPPEA